MRLTKCRGNAGHAKIRNWIINWAGLGWVGLGKPAEARQLSQPSQASQAKLPPQQELLVPSAVQVGRSDPLASSNQRHFLNISAA